MDKEVLRSVQHAWRTHNAINILLIEGIPAKGFQAIPPGSKGRNVAEQWEHMNRIRCGWMIYHRTGKRPSSSSVKLTNLTRASLKKAFISSGKEFEHFLTDLSEGRTKLRAFKNNPFRFMGYLIAHESHHRGSIMLTLKQNGIRMPEAISLKGLWMTWMWGK